jgi:hypothetical protein
LLPQTVLAQALRDALLLAHPNTFAETSCIAALEVMASGGHMITGHRGALPETTGGFASLIPWTDELDAYRQAIVAQTLRVLQSFLAHPADTEDHLRRQVAYIHQAATWPRRAEQ